MYISQWKAFLAALVFLSCDPLFFAANHATAQPAIQGPAHLGVTIDAKDKKTGALVSAVLRRSPAEVAGVAAGDRILKVGEVRVDTLYQLRSALQTYRPGDRVPITLKSPIRETTVVVTARVESKPSPEVVIDRQLSGLPLPDFKLEYLSGTSPRTARSGSLKGKVTVVDFWATWCGPCRKAAPRLEALSERYGDRLQVIGISSESKGTIRKFLGRSPSAYPIAHDPGGLAHTRCTIITFPTMLLLNEKGVVVGTYVGLGDLRQLETDVAARLRTTP